MSELRIEPLSPRDLEGHMPAIRDLLQELSSSGEIRPGEENRIEAALHLGGAAHIVLAKRGERVVGMGMLFLMPHPSNFSAYIHDMVRAGDERGTGIGPILLQYLLETAKASAKLYQQSINVHLTSSNHRVRARKLYEEFGFRLKASAVNPKTGETDPDMTNLYLLTVTP